MFDFVLVLVGSLMIISALLLMNTGGNHRDDEKT